MEVFMTFKPGDKVIPSSNCSETGVAVFNRVVEYQESKYLIVKEILASLVWGDVIKTYDLSIWYPSSLTHYKKEYRNL
jgi:hypothetical protein